MFTAIQDFVFSILPARRTTSQSGWVSFNAPCCQHRGESEDTKGRGGIKPNGEGGISYHCFNCGFTASFVPGRSLNNKFKNLLKWLGTDELEIQRLVIEAARIKELIEPETQPEQKNVKEISFEARPLPAEAKNIVDLARFYAVSDFQGVQQELHDAVEYIIRSRKISTADYSFYWSSETAYNLHRRIIVPFYYQEKIVGYTARAIDPNIKPKYHSSHPADFVFNLDRQYKDNKFVIVCEGPFDAMSLDGVAVLSNEVSEQQAELINRLGREVIVVPDFDKHVNKQGREVWPGAKLIDAAIKYGWSVSFPLYRKSCKDVNEATVEYGKLFVLKDILANKVNGEFKINLNKKKLYA